MANLGPILVKVALSGEVKEALDAMHRELDALNAQIEAVLEELRRGEVILAADRLAAVEVTIESAADVTANVLTGVGVAPSVPEPPPTRDARSEGVTPELLRYMDGTPYVADLLRARDAYGRAKYGQGLMTFDGRDTYEDLLQELGDALQYARKLRMEQEAGESVSMEGVGRLRVILNLLDSDLEIVEVVAKQREE